MKRLALASAAAIAPRPALAHDAFADLGPFYASLLHPLADPLQGALVVGTAAVLASRPVERARIGLPLFLAAAAAALLVLAAMPDLTAPPLLPAAAGVVVGMAAAVPAQRIRRGVVPPLLVASGFLAGLAPGVPGAVAEGGGTLLGLAILATLSWAVLDTLGRRVSSVAPAIAGSWVAAVGLLAAAFTLEPPRDDAAAGSQRDTPSSESTSP
jgi:hypothetical protein